jgi:hypothetical protein
MRVLSSLKDSPLGSSHRLRPASTRSACCLEWQQTAKSSDLTRTGLPGFTQPFGWYRTPAASSRPCSATFISKGETIPPYAQCRVIRSAGLVVLVGAGSAGEHCA